jgi:hypothetical protein
MGKNRMFSWNEEEELEGGLRIVIIQNMFTLEQAMVAQNLFK